MQIEIIKADYANPDHGTAIVHLLNCYAEDKMGGGTPLAEKVKNNLVKELAKLPHAFSLLCYADGQPVGLANCFEGFSTFQCKPLINVHDLIVAGNARGLGISQLLLARVEAIATEKGCCKLTLEVLEGNAVAQNAYRKFGFAGYELDPAMGKAVFWQKAIGVIQRLPR